MALNFVPRPWKVSALMSMLGTRFLLCFYVYFLSNDCAARSALIVTVVSKYVNLTTKLCFILNNITGSCI
jgi:hypothetical protein